MSAPVKGEETNDDLLMYAPPWLRAGTKERAHSPSRLDRSPPMAPGENGYNIDPPPERPAFEGDRDIVEFRRRLSLEPEVVPQPPRSWRRDMRVTPVSWMTFAIGLAAVGAYGIVMLPHWDPPPFGHRASAASKAALQEDPANEEQSGGNLLIEKRLAYANQPVALQLGLNGSSGRENVIVSGLSSGTRLSAGNLSGANWLLSARDLGEVMAIPPKDFVGSMEASVDLRSPRNALLDSRRVRLEWLAQRAAATPVAAAQPDRNLALLPTQKADKSDSDEIAMLLRRSHELLKSGDVSAARLVLQRAANGGSVDALLALGATYDPPFLRELGAIGLAGDAEKARALYQHAQELGSQEASRRIERLSQMQ